MIDRLYFGECIIGLLTMGIGSTIENFAYTFLGLSNIFLALSILIRLDTYKDSIKTKRKNRGKQWNK